MCAPAKPTVATRSSRRRRFIPSVSMQPFMAQVDRVEAALSYLGQPLADQDRERIKAIAARHVTGSAVSQVEAILDNYVLAVVTISPESRVDVKRGPAAPELIQNGTRSFLVKVINQPGITAPLVVSSPNSGQVYITSSGSHEPAQRLNASTWPNVGRIFPCSIILLWKRGCRVCR